MRAETPTFYAYLLPEKQPSAEARQVAVLYLTLTLLTAWGGLAHIVFGGWRNFSWLGPLNRCSRCHAEGLLSEPLHVWEHALTEPIIVHLACEPDS